MRGYLLYSRERYAANRAYADSYVRIGAEKGLDISVLLTDGASDPSFVSAVKSRPDFVINRTNDCNAAAYAEKCGIRAFNNSLTSKTANDKLISYILADKLGVKSYVRRISGNYDRHNLPEQLTYPFVAKDRYSSGGKKVFLVNRDNANAEYTGADYLRQEYVQHVSGDMRSYVIGDKIIANVIRYNDGKLLSNYSLNSHAALCSPPDYIRGEIVKIARYLKSDYIGVDYLVTESGEYIFNEIEDPAGAKSLYALSNVDVAELFSEHISVMLNAEKRVNNNKSIFSEL